MSWKSIELQVALPRTMEAGKLQDQLHKQPQHTQHLLTESQLKREVKKQTRVNNTELQRKIMGNKHSQENHHKTMEETRNGHREINTLDKHPYLGTKVDFKG
ncbi:hypothetical protein [Virgibacillus sp. SK37]|uniref:hypothetical protein n=1 Tax=Virgibacillus sp. SK37 TaxID=403957 RepID=UPI0004D15E13|nr:hypothetical protein [Virgibacillus sp. SK37]AIF43736.1 hypothetical protein X953_11805 [Virgibacillus sp. SK37]